MRLQLYENVPDGNSALTPAGLIEVERLKGCLPVDALVSDGQPYIEWMEMSDVTLSEPFFQQTVEKARMKHPARNDFITDINALIQFEKLADFLRPTGFIFHASRCGSTLVSNACRALRDTLVFSEPYVVDKLVGQFFTMAQGEGLLTHLWQIFLRGAVSALGQRMSGQERHFIIKFACCGILQLKLIRRIWPEVPWVFIYRDPVEIMVSNLKNVPDWMLTEEQPEHTSAMLELTQRDVSRMSRDEFCARALGKFYAMAAEQADDRAMLIAYEQLSPETLSEVASFFGAAPSAAEMDEITRVSRLYSKDSTRAFGGDADIKRRAASPLTLEMAERWAAEPFERLRRRHRQSVGH